MLRLEQFINNNNACLVAVTEHWQSTAELEVLTIRGFKLASKYCRPINCHGGCAIYCKDEIIFKERSDLVKASIPYVFECSAIEAQLNNKKVIIISIYRPNSYPRCDINLFFEQIHHLLQNLTDSNSQYIIAGDFNVNVLLNNSETQKFLSILQGFGANLTVHEATRITSNSATCIDNFITNLNNYDVAVLPSHISDHTAQIFSFPVGKAHSKSVRKQIRLINNSTVKTFLELLSVENWDDLSIYQNIVDIDLMWDMFFSKYKTIFDTAFPLVVMKSESSREKYVDKSPEVQEIKKRLDCLYTISQSRPEMNHIYQITKKSYDECIKLNKRKFLREKIDNSSNKSKMVWKVINQVIGRKYKNDFKMPRSDGPQELADAFNRQFIDVPTSLNTQSSFCSSGDSNPRSIRYNERSFFLFEITADEVIRTAKAMENKGSFGYDEIPMTVIKRSIEIVAKPVAHIMYIAFRDGIFPRSLKVAVVKPLFKKGNTDDVGNYRPISLLTSFSKLFEKVLVSRLLNFFHKFHLFSKFQHGFLKTRSTETALFELSRSILHALECGEVPVGLFLDFSRAFDCVSHKILLDKLNSFGIRNKQLDLMKSYLEDRVQRVSIEIDGAVFVSCDEILSSGVPQGSIAGPLLFLVYINDLPECILIEDFMSLNPNDLMVTKTEENKDIVMYADDTNLVVAASNVSEVVGLTRNKFCKIAYWCRRNQISLNLNKTECVIFCTSHSKIKNPETIDLMGQNVELSHRTNFLGITVDEHLNWYDHIDTLQRKLNSVLYAIRILVQHADLELLKTVYFSNFQSIMSYGIIVWGNSSDISRIFVVQKRALRTMLRLSSKTSCRGIFRREGILTITALYIFRCLTFLRTNFLYFEKYLNSNMTRRIYSYHLPKCSLTLSQRNVEYMCLTLFNKLPKNYQVLTTVKNFKKEVRKLLTDLEPYSLDDYLNYKFPV